MLGGQCTWIARQETSGNPTDTPQETSEMSINLTDFNMQNPQGHKEERTARTYIIHCNAYTYIYIQYLIDVTRS